MKLPNENVYPWENKGDTNDTTTNTTLKTNKEIMLPKYNFTEATKDSFIIKVPFHKADGPKMDWYFKDGSRKFVCTVTVDNGDFGYNHCVNVSVPYEYDIDNYEENYSITDNEYTFTFKKNKSQEIDEDKLVDRLFEKVWKRFTDNFTITKSDALPNNTWGVHPLDCTLKTHNGKCYKENMTTTLFD